MEEANIIQEITEFLEAEQFNIYKYDLINVLHCCPYPTIYTVKIYDTEPILIKVVNKRQIKSKITFLTKINHSIN